MEYFKNTILVGDTLERTDETGTQKTILPDFLSLNLPSLHRWIDECNPVWFTYIRIDANDTLQRLSLEMYGNPSYWDIIMLVNKRTPFDCLPYDDDTIKSMATNKANRYKEKVYGGRLPYDDYIRLYEKYLVEMETDNNSRFIIKIVKPSYMQEFLQLGFEEDKF